VVAGVAEADAASVATCRVVGAAAGALDPAELHAATVVIVASSTPVTGRKRTIFMSLVTREPGVWLGLTTERRMCGSFESSRVVT
jgi:hypothetical protein